MTKRILAAVAAAFTSIAAIASADDIVNAAIASERMRGDQVQDAYRKPADVLRFLEVTPGHAVLDWNAGPGYWSELLSRIVGAQGQVLIYNDPLYAQAAHGDITTRLARKRLPNAKQIFGPNNYLKLEPESLDRVLIALVYHDIYWQPRDAPEPMGDAKKVLALLHGALKPGGLIVVIDHNAGITPQENVVRVASRLHRIDPNIVREDFSRAGFEFAGESAALRHENDDPTTSVFNPMVRHRTNQFIYKFRKP